MNHCMDITDTNECSTSNAIHLQSLFCGEWQVNLDDFGTNYSIVNIQSSKYSTICQEFNKAEIKKDLKDNMSSTTSYYCYDIGATSTASTFQQLNDSTTNSSNVTECNSFFLKQVDGWDYEVYELIYDDEQELEVDVYETSYLSLGYVDRRRRNYILILFFFCSISKGIRKLIHSVRHHQSQQKSKNRISQNLN